MNSYRVKVEQTSYCVVEVKAEDEFDAEAVAIEMWGDGDLDGLFQHDVQIIIED
jgi:hypothetical protein